MSLLHSFSLFTHTTFLWVAGIFGIGFLIGLHELGHFLFCKLFKIRTPSFSIGFGPTLFEKKFGETLFKVSAIPLGGYVEIAGSAEVGQGEQKDAYARDEHSLAVKPYWQKMLVMAGGIIFNTMFAYLTFITLFWAGAPKTLFLYPLNATPTIAQVIPNSPAASHDLKPGDTVIKVDNQATPSVAELLDTIKASPGKPISLTISRDKEEKTVDLVIGTQNGSSGTLGIIYKTITMPPQSFMQAIKSGIRATHQSIAQIFYTLKYIFIKRSLETVGGPLMIIAQSVKGAAQGAKIFFALLAFISINLAVLNILPLPITDGGQVLFYTIEAITRRELPEKIKIVIHYVSWLLIMALFVYLSIKDVWRIIKHWF